MLDNVASELFFINACSSGKLENVKWFIAKMWKYISWVLKVVEEEKKEETHKAASDSKEYDKNRTKKFSAKWQVRQPWLQHDHNGVGGGGVNFWASEN